MNFLAPQLDSLAADSASPTQLAIACGAGGLLLLALACFLRPRPVPPTGRAGAVDGAALDEKENFVDSRKMGLFWDLYIPLYDKLCLLEPYEELMNDIVAKVDPGAERVLDLACGTGNVGAAVKARLPHAGIAGLDCNEAMLAQCGAKNPWMATRLGSMDERLPYPDDHFDVAICNNAFYLVDDPKFSLSEMCRVTKPGGRVVVSTPSTERSIWTILRQHRRKRGLLSLMHETQSLVLMAIINLVFGVNGNYNFFSREDFVDLVGREADLDLSYAGTCFLATRIVE